MGMTLGVFLDVCVSNLDGEDRDENWGIKFFVRDEEIVIGKIELTNLFHVRYFLEEILIFGNGVKIEWVMKR